MPVKTRIGIFAALWVLLGGIHAVFGREAALPLWIGFALLTFPIRSLLLKSVLDLQLEDWLKTTAKAALRGIGGAFCAILAVFVANFFTHLTFGWYILAAFIAFRLAVIWWQYRHIEKLNLNWLYFNIGGLGLYTLVLIVYFQTISVYYGDFVLPFLGIILSELLVSFAYINLKLDEDLMQKRKVEEMQQ